MQRRARNTGARKSGAAELDTTEMRAPHLNRLAVPTCREDSSRHASGKTEAPARSAPRGWRSRQQLKLLPVAYKTVQKRSPGTHSKTYNHHQRRKQRARPIQARYGHPRQYRGPSAAAQEAR